MRIGMMCGLVLAGLCLTTQAMAKDSYASFFGTKQGQFKGDVTDPHYPNQSEVVAIDWGLSQPAAPAVSPTGLAVAVRRTHDPLTLTLRMGPATPQLIQAATTNETLKQVMILVFGKTPDGLNELRDTLNLSNARITSIRIVDRNGTDNGVDPLVVVAFAYQTLEIEDKASKLMTQDSWLVP